MPCTEHVYQASWRCLALWLWLGACSGSMPVLQNDYEHGHGTQGTALHSPLLLTKSQRVGSVAASEMIHALCCMHVWALPTILRSSNCLAGGMSESSCTAVFCH
jgi:hypothetical protein